MAGRPKGLKQNNIIKFRASDDFINVINDFKKGNPFYTNGKSDSEIYRWLILEGALRYSNGDTWKKIQAEIEKH